MLLLFYQIELLLKLRRGTQKQKWPHAFYFIYSYIYISLLEDPFIEIYTNTCVYSTAPNVGSLPLLSTWVTAIGNRLVEHPAIIGTNFEMAFRRYYIQIRWAILWAFYCTSWEAPLSPALVSFLFCFWLNCDKLKGMLLRILYSIILSGR